MEFKFLELTGVPAWLDSLLMNLLILTDSWNIASCFFFSLLSSFISNPNQLKRLLELIKSKPKTNREQLPSYAVPLFLRFLKEVQITGTFKHQKVSLKKEGIDVTVVKDPIYWLNVDSNKYEPFDLSTLQRISSGKAKLWRDLPSFLLFIMRVRKRKKEKSIKYWLIDWLVGWLVGWLIDWLVDWLVGWLVGWISKFAHWLL